MRQSPPAEILNQLRAAADAGHMIVIEIVENGKRLYLRDHSLFGQGPVEDPYQARNYALDTPSFGELWYHVNTLYVKDEGGGKSAVRTDIPGAIAIFERPSNPPLIARIPSRQTKTEVEKLQDILRGRGCSQRVIDAVGTAERQVNDMIEGGLTLESIVAFTVEIDAASKQQFNSAQRGNY